jgi:hypothetical protein
MEKRYQVFVSSTYEDLREERQEVMQALLELKCIPAGMELFPAADEDSWTLIKRFIAECDYYIVIVGGRYGSTGPDGKGYTEMEYEHARQSNLPIMAFLHADPGKIIADKTEKTEPGKVALVEFRKRIEERRHCKYWSSPKDLGGVVSRSMLNLINTKPGIGWVRANLVPDESAAQEILRLRKTAEDLRLQVEQLATSPPPHTEHLSQGEETIEIAFDGEHAGELHSSRYEKKKVAFTWNELLAKLGPIMLNQATETDMQRKFIEVFRNKWADQNLTDLYNVSIRNEDFQRVKMQLIALGLIMKGDHAGYWTLTPYGTHRLTQVAAIPAQKGGSDQ